MDDDATDEPVIVPLRTLPAETLRRVIESFVLREGTEYGEREVALEAKVADVRRQLERGDAEIVYDPKSQSVDIVVRRVGHAGRRTRAS